MRRSKTYCDLETRQRLAKMSKIVYGSRSKWHKLASRNNLTWKQLETFMLDLMEKAGVKWEE